MQLAKLNTKSEMRDAKFLSLRYNLLNLSLSAI